MSEFEHSFEKLIRNARNGDETALGELLNQHRPWLRLLGKRGLSDRFSGRIDESDVAQQTFLSAVRGFSEFNGSTADELAAWLQQIHERNLQDAVRRHVVAQKRSVDREETFIEEEVLPIELTSPSQRLIRGERAVRLAAALSYLPEEQAEAVRLRHLDGQSLEKIARQLDRSERAVAGLLYRGMTNLRKVLAEESKEKEQS
ncbi:MAG: sigma-70 family RNA polymerase sigma factor [Rhodopirellula sp.]|nr:sigma-70 family RNA polymerase sigma factor [Rhodopirellula sp.]